MKVIFFLHHWLFLCSICTCIGTAASNVNDGRNYPPRIGFIRRNEHPERTATQQRTLWQLRGGTDSSSSQVKFQVSFTGRLRNLISPKKDAKINPRVAINAAQPYNPLRMYLSCMGIVVVWISTGTLFYSYYNDWPMAQSFFYAVDAGMSIGFCTQVYETKLLSKAFTIVFILLGASVVGGALALFIQDALEGLSSPSVHEYKVLLEREVFDKADLDHSGVLSFDQFERLIQSSFIHISQEDITRLWTKFDRLKDGVIHFEEFAGTYRGIDGLVQRLERQQRRLNPLQQIFSQCKHWLQQAWQLENRIYFVFLLWISTGILWGMIDQGWDLITATHFAVSALATGGLTAPDVNADGILPAEPAIFCGVFCLLGIPLFALTLGHFALVLVSGHVKAMEQSAMTRPMTTPEEYELAAHLTTRDSVVHLSDFIVLQLLRQGKLSIEALQLLKENFELLDTDQKGVLSLEQAVCHLPALNSTTTDSDDTDNTDDATKRLWK